MQINCVKTLVTYQVGRYSSLCHCCCSCLEYPRELPFLLINDHLTALTHHSKLCMLIVPSIRYPWSLQLPPSTSTKSSSLLSPYGNYLTIFFLGCVHACCHFRRVRLFATLWTLAHQAPLSMGFSRQEYWSGLPCPPPGDLLDPGIEPGSLESPTLAGRFFTKSMT